MVKRITTIRAMVERTRLHCDSSGEWDTEILDEIPSYYGRRESCTINGQPWANRTMKAWRGFKRDTTVGIFSEGKVLF